MTENTSALETCEEVRIKGKNTAVRSLRLQNRTVVLTGTLLRTASIKDEAFVAGPILPEPKAAIADIRAWKARPDIFTFSEKINQPITPTDLPHRWENYAVIPITTYDEWLKTRIRKDVKENLRRAKREGVVVRTSPYDAAFVKGIYDLCNETPIRQGKPFWHYGKSYDAIEEVHGTYKERAEYIGAYLDQELIGFIKMVYVDDYAKTMHVISKERHFHRRPTNALIAKAVEVCAEKHVNSFIYGEYSFPGKPTSSLTEFKRHHGFEERKYRRFVVPISPLGSIALRMGLDCGPQSLLPPRLLELILRIRAGYYNRRHRKVEAKKPTTN